MNIAIIPARIGSKRIKKKNIKFFLGKPIIQFTIEKLIKMKFFNQIYISTDSEKIKLIFKKYKKYNVHVPFIRPKKYSGDFSGTREVVLHAINEIKINSQDNIFCIYPTSVFINKKILRNAIKIINKQKRIYIFSAKQIEKNFFRSFFLEKKKLKVVFKKNIFKRTQDIKNAYVDAAQFYLAKTSTWIKNKNIFNKNAKFVELDRFQSHDIDYPSDWIYAENLYKNLKKK